MTESDNLLTLEVEKEARAESDAVYAKKEAAWKVYRDQYQAMRGANGDTIDRIAALVRRYGPKLMMFMGLPAGTAGLTALMTDEGSFSGITDGFKSLLALLF